MGRDITSHKLRFGDGWTGESSMTKGKERGISTPTEEANSVLCTEVGQRRGPAPDTAAQKDACCRTWCLRSLLSLTQQCAKLADGF